MSEIIKLTGRQREFLVLVSEGLTRSQIAERCDVSAWTVKSTLDDARERLDAGNLPQAVMKAFALGILTSSDQVVA
jgi:DNA-binding CsgD family transcriptional regulator